MNYYCCIKMTVYYPYCHVDCTQHVGEVKQTYMRYLSHEIRTPLNVATLGLHVLQEGVDNGTISLPMDAKQTLNDIRDACDISVNQLSEMLLYDKLHYGLKILERKPVILYRCLLQSIKTFFVQVK